jgi:hypothetical protein
MDNLTNLTLTPVTLTSTLNCPGDISHSFLSFCCWVSVWFLLFTDIYNRCCCRYGSERMHAGQQLVGSRPVQLYQRQLHCPQATGNNCSCFAFSLGTPALRVLGYWQKGRWFESLIYQWPYYLTNRKIGKILFCAWLYLCLSITWLCLTLDS